MPKLLALVKRFSFHRIFVGRLLCCRLRRFCKPQSDYVRAKIETAEMDWKAAVKFRRLEYDLWTLCWFIRANKNRFDRNTESGSLQLTCHFECARTSTQKLVFKSDLFVCLLFIVFILSTSMNVSSFTAFPFQRSTRRENIDQIVRWLFCFLFRILLCNLRARCSPFDGRIYTSRCPCARRCFSVDYSNDQV